MIWRVKPAALIKPCSGGNIHLAADYRLHALTLAFVIKLNSGKNIAVIGHGNCAHSHFAHTGNKLLEPARTVKQRIFTVNMQMNEFGHILFLSFVCILRLRSAAGSVLPQRQLTGDFFYPLKAMISA